MRVGHRPIRFQPPGETGLPVGDGHRPARYLLPRRRQPRRGDAFVDLAEIGETGREADCVNAVFALLVNVDDFVDAESAALGERLEIGTRLGTVINRQGDELALGRFGGVEIGQGGAQALPDREGIAAIEVVEDQQRGVGRDQIDEAILHARGYPVDRGLDQRRYPRAGFVGKIDDEGILPCDFDSHAALSYRRACGFP